MPEGDTIATYARRLGPWLEDATIRRALCRWPRVVEGVEGKVVREVRPLGKHLLIGLSDRTTLRIHLRMTGSWHRYDPGEPWLKSRGDLALALVTDEHEVVCFKAPDVERIDDRALLTHPVLSALGPDLMHPEVDLDEVLERAAERRPARVADLLLDQRVACGLGNVYKSELCFLFGLDPFGDPADLDPGLLRSLYERGGQLLRANVGRDRNTTGRRRPAYWVYRRDGRHCLRCGSRIASYRADAADRWTWWCPSCQSGAPR